MLVIFFMIASASESLFEMLGPELCNFEQVAPRSVSAKYRRIKNRHRLPAWITVFIALALSISCHAAKIVLLRSSGSPSPEQYQLELATEFYGLDLKTVVPGVDQPLIIYKTIQEDTTVAVAIEASSLASIDQEKLLQALRRGHKDSLPLIILGVTSETDQNLLSRWSGSTVTEVKSLNSSGSLHYISGNERAVTHQLTGLEFPFPAGKTFYLKLDQRSDARVILAVRSDRQIVPVLIEKENRGQKIFLLSRTLFADDNGVDLTAQNAEEAFGKIAAVMVFTKYCAAEHGWHSFRHYANLTIDDPWLREPYGNLNYANLLQEMEKHNFHTTIAFIPWNYDRSRADVVSLFLGHADRFSICIHGDDHAHKEFTDYASKPLGVQVAALRQSVARMDRFQAQSGIPYDRVMVFPHSIAPEQTLEALKANDYLATINSRNVPMDSIEPADLLFALRPVTLLFGNFPSILRYPAVEPTPSYRIAIQDFLDNPLFYYVHQDFFAKGSDAFDGLADEVNRLEPDTKWRSVGDIVKHLYLLRLREDSNYDVLAFSSNLLLENTYGHNLVFHVKKEEEDSLHIKSVTVDGERVPFQLHNRSLDLSIPIPAGKTSSVVIHYNNNPDFASVSVSRGSAYVYILRQISDFRDIELSKLRVGRSFTSLYYTNGVAVALMIFGSCGLIALCTAGIWKFMVISKRRKDGQAALGQIPGR